MTQLGPMNPLDPADLGPGLKKLDLADLGRVWVQMDPPQTRPIAILTTTMS